MASLSIQVEYITGRSVAAQVSDRDAAEWPPHPGRLFMALAATCFEMGEDESEVAALKWLESLPQPLIDASDAEERSRVSVYVPVNDKVTASKSLLQSTPGLSRSKQERSFPTVIPHDPMVRFLWEQAPGAEQHLEALSNICDNVIRLGHSSSLVRASVSTQSAEFGQACWRPSTSQSQIQVRVACQGEFERLRAACKADRIDAFAEISERIETITGKAKKQAKTEFETAFGEPYKNSHRPPEATPPVIGTWQGYSRGKDLEVSQVVVEGKHFESTLIVLAKLDGRSLGIEDTIALTSRLRDAAMSHCVIQPPPAWLSGHEHDGSVTTEPHVAFIALPYVGSPHADGHVMGLALVLPKGIPPQDRGHALSELLVNESGEPHNVKLTLGGLGEWTLQLEERAAPPKSLCNGMWVGPSDTWASVTPVVLDRFPKSSRTADRAGWQNEVIEIVARSCKLAGLPSPIEVDIDTTPWHRGSVRAIRKTRSQRRNDRRDENADTLPPSGNGFPPLPSRPGKPRRPQVHVYLKFGQPVLGPVILGAGRFIGYGLCKPLKRDK